MEYLHVVVSAVHNYVLAISTGGEMKFSCKRWSASKISTDGHGKENTIGEGATTILIIKGFTKYFTE